MVGVDRTSLLQIISILKIKKILWCIEVYDCMCEIEGSRKRERERERYRAEFVRYTCAAAKILRSVLRC